MYVCVYVCVCVCIYIYIYIARPRGVGRRPSPGGWGRGGSVEDSSSLTEISYPAFSTFKFPVFLRIPVPLLRLCIFNLQSFFDSFADILHPSVAYSRSIDR